MPHAKPHMHMLPVLRLRAASIVRLLAQAEHADDDHHNDQRNADAETETQIAILARQRRTVDDVALRRRLLLRLRWRGFNGGRRLRKMSRKCKSAKTMRRTNTCSITVFTDVSVPVGVSLVPLELVEPVEPSVVSVSAVGGLWVAVSVGVIGDVSVPIGVDSVLVVGDVAAVVVSTATSVSGSDGTSVVVHGTLSSAAQMKRNGSSSTPHAVSRPAHCDAIIELQYVRHTGTTVRVATIFCETGKKSFFSISRKAKSSRVRAMLVPVRLHGWHCAEQPIERMRLAHDVVVFTSSQADGLSERTGAGAELAPMQPASVCALTAKFAPNWQTLGAPTPAHSSTPHCVVSVTNAVLHGTAAPTVALQTDVDGQ